MAESVLNLPSPHSQLPEVVELYREDFAQMGFTGRELAAIKERTGKSLSEVLDDEHSDDRFLVFAWLKLRREGYRLEWDDMLDIVVKIKPSESLDPTNAGRSETSPPSATTGE